MSDVLISTGDIKQDYEIVDIVFAVQVFSTRIIGITGEKTLEALPKLNKKLKKAAEALGCNAIIWMRYDSDTVDPGVQRVIAYGTGVKLK